MRLLRLEVAGANLFEESSFAMDLFATDRVVNPDRLENPGSVHRLGKNGSVYSQNVVGIAGINASGKTTALKLLRLALSLVGGEYTFRGYVSGLDSPIARLGDHVMLRILFWYDDAFYLLETALVKDGTSADGPFFGLSISDEALWRHAGARVKKSDLSSSEAFKRISDIVMRRNGAPGDPTALSDEQRRFLTPFTSITVALGVGGFGVGVPTRSLPEETLSDGVVQAFDGSIESMRWDSESEVFHLKYKNGPERIVSRDVAVELLSTGTVVGSEMVMRAASVLREGGYMLVDEVEQSLNKSLVAVFIGLFTSPATNPHGAQLVFTTHYTQVLDNLRRGDGIYLLTRDDSFKTRVSKYTDAFPRDDYRKSDVIMSNAIRGTNPKYEDVQRLNRYVAQMVGDADE